MMAFGSFWLNNKDFFFFLPHRDPSVAILSILLLDTFNNNLSRSVPKTSTLIGCTLWCIAAGDTAACYSSLVKYQIYPFKAVKKKKKKDSHKCDNDPLRTFFFIWDQTIIWLQCSSLGLAFNTHTHTHAHTHTHTHTQI